MTLTVVSHPAQGGEITSDPDSLTLLSGEYHGNYFQYDNVTLTAIAKAGYKFVSWTGDVSEIDDTSQKTIVVRMDKYFAHNDREIEIIANFEETVPWAWVAGGITALLLAAMALATAMLVRRRKKRQADTETP